MDEMDRLTDLGAALYPTQGPSAQLRTRVLAGLAHPTAPATRVRPLLVAGGGAALAVTAILTAGTVAGPGTVTGPDAGGGPAPVDTAGVQPVAFTVRVNDDGSVTFTARDLVDSGAATRALNQAGIAGRVVNFTSDCASGPINPGDVDETRPGRKAIVGWRGGQDTVTVRSSDYAPGGGLLFAVTVAVKKQDGRVGVGVMVRPFKDVRRIPPCVARRDPVPTSTPS